VNNVVVASSTTHQSPHNQGLGTSPTMQPENKRPRLNGPEVAGTLTSTVLPQQTSNNYMRGQTTPVAARSSPRTEQVQSGAAGPRASQPNTVDIVPMLKHYSGLLEKYVKDHEALENIPEEQKVREALKLMHVW